jgi:hypothetical protein
MEHVHLQMDNASSHRNDIIRTIINKHNKVLYIRIENFIIQ